ncbi:hypothetical protein BCD48_18705 [Pseudofrankia sp. BMG5.36]|nr:hypothetical protein BCD48_18705 [Pseudofrankia sp. BMG5.36]
MVLPPEWLGESGDHLLEETLAILSDPAYITVAVFSAFSPCPAVPGAAVSLPDAPPGRSVDASPPLPMTCLASKALTAEVGVLS